LCASGCPVLQHFCNFQYILTAMILIVDDKPENIFALRTILEMNGFSTDAAYSGEEALRKILRNTYALLILDVQMPGMDGFEVAEAVSGYSKSRDIPILFLSAVSTDKQFIKKGYSSGGMDYITKPIDPDILLLKVKTFHKLYEQNRELNETQATLRSEIEFRKKAEEELIRAVRKRDEFISIASHELKTPLTSIKAYIQLLDRTIDEESPTRSYVERTLLQIKKLDNLIVDLLDLSKIESGKLKFNKKVFNFGSMLSGAIDMIRQTYPDYRIIYHGSCDTEVFGDEMRLEQVVLNYLSNAVKYSPDNKEIEIGSALIPGLPASLSGDDFQQGPSVTVHVRDFGIGISKEFQQEIFQKFFRVEESARHFQGLGIGLYICSEIIRRHEGELGVESEPGQGSSFYFTIPLRPSGPDIIL
jgi:two-component system, sensor histidine kinase and response regulator